MNRRKRTSRQSGGRAAADGRLNVPRRPRFELAVRTPSLPERDGVLDTSLGPQSVDPAFDVERREMSVEDLPVVPDGADDVLHERGLHGEAGVERQAGLFAFGDRDAEERADLRV